MIGKIAAKRGITVRLITDQREAGMKRSKVSWLMGYRGIKVHHHNPHRMHNKVQQQPKKTC